MELYKQLREGEKGAWVSIFTYLILSSIKLTIGYVGNSEALLADGLNNATDIIASIAVLVGLRISQKPPDQNHHYGHLRAETVASLVASFIMLAVGIQVIIQSVQGMFHSTHQEPSLLTATVAFGSAIVMYIVYRYNLALSKKVKSTAVKAAAYDNRSDALVSIGTTIGILAAIFGYSIIDTITALLVGLLIIKTAFDIFVESVHTLTDGFDEEEVETLSVLTTKVKGVLALKDFKGRTHGNMMFVDLTVLVAPELTVVESHRITEDIERKIHHLKPLCVVHVHIEPYKEPPVVELE
ncbi:cation diffusion facilitator family transporter [Paenisporosarcina cavernae]|uniref:Cation transporter n=1 Tax=Paenisporosarcina cavernae TaxID=2320858 RepID=A0A385YTI7_9BACL|nr:cation diffusion facilitator family transporter [Paenisporosarcina cavernae]AYC30195.1 cation transporter [Paenisporosarcina cavernae]